MGALNRIGVVENGTAQGERPNNAEPVSSRDIRLEMTFGQPPDTASINFEGSRSMVWVMESLTAAPKGSSSIVQSDVPSAFSWGLS